MQFTYIEDKLPVPNITVLAAWMRSDERYVVPSVWNGENWVSSTWNWNGETWHSRTYSGFVRRGTGYPWHSNFRDSRRPGFHVYAWAPWPDTPEIPVHEHGTNETELLHHTLGRLEYMRDNIVSAIATVDADPNIALWGRGWEHLRKTLVGLRDEINDALSA